ncbi:phenylacetate--CoA ligase family protein [Candidatus Methanoliparum sp. LAM-1]|uniref:phenylacetate--CoA ligase family protein n=1 Tax=Candidatus Methanoliparum sp. LAM-1 TaxID=2874846 RepID=UPI001E400603|nr:phenylacetate--CoA ligase [Candidatus Methanoliparum sp. LAM-1]
MLIYIKKFKDVGLRPEDIKDIDDLTKLPFTTKDNLRNNYPFGMLAVPMKDVVRLHTSSGTTGNPIVLAYTKKDLENWARLTARCLSTIGVNENDVFQNMIGYHMFTGGLGYHYGAELLNATVIPAGSGNTRRQVKMFKDFKVTAVHAIPSYMFHIADVCSEMNIDPIQDLYLKKGIFGAEPWSNSIRDRLEDVFGINAYDNYGLSEMSGPDVAVECECKGGLHLWSDYFLAEIIDPVSGERLEDGEKGELVLTTLCKEAMPLIRYRTRDITILADEECSCGIKHPRISRLLGRTDDMIVVRGTNVFLSQIEDVLLKIPGIRDNYQIIINRDVMDELIIKVEVTKDIFNDEPFTLLALKNRAENELRTVLNLKTTVELVEPQSIPDGPGKTKRIVDFRSI